MPDRASVPARLWSNFNVGTIFIVRSHPPAGLLDRGLRLSPARRDDVVIRRDERLKRRTCPGGRCARPSHPPALPYLDHRRVRTSNRALSFVKASDFCGVARIAADGTTLSITLTRNAAGGRSGRV